MAEPDSSLPVAFVVHSIPYRTRLRIPGQRHRPTYIAQLAEQLSAHPRVRQVLVNAATGSVLVQHEGVIASIAADLRDTIRIVPRPSGASVRHVAPRSGKVLPVSARRLAAAGCVALGAWQLRRGNLMGTASENLWQAYSSWRHLRGRGVAAALLGGGIVQMARGQVLSPAVSLLFYAMNLSAAGKRASKPE